MSNVTIYFTDETLQLLEHMLQCLGCERGAYDGTRIADDGEASKTFSGAQPGAVRAAEAGGGGQGAVIGSLPPEGSLGCPPQSSGPFGGRSRPGCPFQVPTFLPIGCPVFIGLFPGSHQENANPDLRSGG